MCSQRVRPSKRLFLLLFMNRAKVIFKSSEFPTMCEYYAEPNLQEELQMRKGYYSVYSYAQSETRLILTLSLG